MIEHINKGCFLLEPHITSGFYNLLNSRNTCGNIISKKNKKQKKEFQLQILTLS